MDVSYAAILSTLWVAFTIAAQIVLFYLLAERLWPGIQMIRYVLMPYFFPNEQSLHMKYGSWAVVTGSTDGIGKAYAFELASRNINLVLISRNEDKLMKTALEIEAKYPIKTKIIVADFSNSSEEFYKNIENQLEDIPIGILVNNVGINYPYPMSIHQLTEKQTLDIVNINVVSMVMMTRMILPIMLKNHCGAIINVSSGSELQPWPYMSIYASTKAFVKNYTEALRFEYNTKRIAVQTLSPMFTNTKINDFSTTLRETNILIPTPETYARHAIRTLGKLSHTTGYWPHGIQYFLSSLAPYQFRILIAAFLNQKIREEYDQKLLKSE